MQALPSFTLITAATLDNGIGLDNDLPWRLPQDFAYFRRVTARIPKLLLTDRPDLQRLQNAVVMGRLTWESVPIGMQPLSDNFNIVISRNGEYFRKFAVPPDTALATTFDAAISRIDPVLHPRTFVIGGAQVYKEAICSPRCARILLTRIHASIHCDAFFPKIDPTLFRRATHDELVSFVEEDVPEGRQVEDGLEFEYLLFVRRDNVQSSG